MQLFTMCLITMRLITMRLTTMCLFTMRLTTMCLITMCLITMRLVTMRLITMRLITMRLTTMRLITMCLITRNVFVASPSIDMTTTKLVKHTFVWKYPCTSAVLRGSFTSPPWAVSIPLTITADGAKASVTVLIPPGEHTYKLVVDDEWHLISYLPICVGSDGIVNNLLVLDEAEAELADPSRLKEENARREVELLGSNLQSGTPASNQAHAGALVGLQAQLHAKDTLLSQEREKVLELRKALEVSKNEADELRRLQSVREESEKAAEVLELQHVILELQHENAELERMLHASTSAVHKELAKQQDAHASEKAELLAQLDHANHSAAEAERSMDLDRDSELRNAHKGMVEAQSEVRALTRSLNDTRALLRDSQERIAELEDQLRNREAAIDGHAEQLSRLADHSSSTDAKRLRDIVSTLEAEKRGLEAVVRAGSHYRSSLPDAPLPAMTSGPARESQPIDPNADAAVLLAQLENARAQNAHLTFQLEEYETENAELRALLAELKAKAPGGALFSDDQPPPADSESADDQPSFNGSESIFNSVAAALNEQSLAFVDDSVGDGAALDRVVVNTPQPGVMSVAASPGASIFRATPSPRGQQGAASSARSRPSSGSRMPLAPSPRRRSPSPTRKHASKLAPTPSAAIFASRSRANWWPQKELDARLSASRLARRAWKPPGPKPPGPNEPSITTAHKRDDA
ncbi:uncharacterized protein AMSG_09886 [Thecamonas trahens ATCC 50062]|uniref:AMP-activated protein kinase glycogen-binding domain-containing protein n=1 Tax=Thecamonas trahens ATCC 50062 TaxID=461836 RepID=A0A0L0DP84_THETB|nr:hypothetical protein AMSG_09886 [Thecamonas trahens ATCC 50062]KNC54112.1 hypothetical protein AMSG_09886 [Thecamonas trahens ATCC 50062]|eukprot:XP_013753935.1 hypothetical protein AMSG_09886 [Thecamonas trahens ATCC 50062]